jgi:hypothetical protein
MNGTIYNVFVFAFGLFVFFGLFFFIESKLISRTPYQRLLRSRDRLYSQIRSIYIKKRDYETVYGVSVSSLFDNKINLMVLQLTEIKNQIALHEYFKKVFNRFCCNLNF